jgi:DNA-binding response OmpR family regulator
VLRRVKPADPERPEDVEIGPLRVEFGSRRAFLDGAELSLSRKEFDLLAELVSHAGEVVKREDLIARVWDENWFGSTKTLDVHVGWLRGKLGDDASAPRLIHTVRGVGFRFTGPSEWAS